MSGFSRTVPYNPDVPTHVPGTRGGTSTALVLRYDVTRDGKRFLINSEPQSAQVTSAPITVVLNWASALKN